MAVINKKVIIKKTISTLMVILGTGVMAIGSMAFLSPHNIVPGGFTGFAILLYKTIIPFISPGIMALVLNVPLFIVALKIKGKSFGFLSVVGTISYSLCIDLIILLKIDNVMMQIAEDKLLASIYGGIFMGIGYGIIIRFGGSTGGSDTLANILSSVKPGVSFGTVLLLIDGFVIILSGIAFSIQESIKIGVPAALYAFLVIYLTAKIADYVIEGKKSSRAYYIICSEPEVMTKAIFENMGRGVTALKAKGMYTKNEKEVLMCIVLRTQSAQLKQLVFGIDPKAFVYSGNLSEVLGEGFANPAQMIGKKKKSKVNIKGVATLSSSEFTVLTKLPAKDVIVAAVEEETAKEVNIAAEETASENT